MCERSMKKKDDTILQLYESSEMLCTKHMLYACKREVLEGMKTGRLEEDRGF